MPGRTGDAGAMPALYHLVCNGITWAFYEQMDRSRRRQGRLLAAMGWGPCETPSRPVFRERGVTLKGFSPAQQGGAPVLLMVPAPIKRAYIWDLAPEASVVRRAMQAGLRPYLIQWETAEAGSQGLGLAAYADRLLLDCLQAVEAETGAARAFLAGHSLGGTLAAIFAALHPERVRGLVLLAAPLRLGREVGVFGPFAAALAQLSLATDMPALVPGSFLSALSFALAPATFGTDRYLDRWRSLPDAELLRSHLRVERWTLDELAMPRTLFEEVVELLIREDRYMRGSLSVGGRLASPAQLQAPLLCVADPRCPIVPPEAVVPFFDAVPNADKKLLWYGGDVGVCLQHVGMLVGRNAHARLWPEVLDWACACSARS